MVIMVDSLRSRIVYHRLKYQESNTWVYSRQTVWREYAHVYWIENGKRKMTKVESL